MTIAFDFCRKLTPLLVALSIGCATDGPVSPGADSGLNDSSHTADSQNPPANDQGPASDAPPPAPDSGNVDPEAGTPPVPASTYPINGTGQSNCYDANGKASCPTAGSAFYGQDANYKLNAMSFKDNGDDTISDLNTGLMWAKVSIDKMSWDQAAAGAATFNLGNHSDWRLPTIKEMYSLIHFDGGSQMDEAHSIPYIDTAYFDFAYGDTTAGDRLIDAQYITATKYVSTTMNGDETFFGVNFADGRIKGYPVVKGGGGGSAFTGYVKYVRGNTSYGQNSLTDNGDQTITDKATGLTWQKGDSGSTLGWQDALAYCENLSHAGKSDWRLPHAKELHSIVDYTRAPTITNSAAIDPLFDVTEIQSYFWTSTSHLEGPDNTKGQNAVYIAFGQAWGFMEMPPNSGQFSKIDVHGAGAQRSDPKTGDPNDYPQGHGPQGDDIRIYNYVRCVR
jgi:hypothetical protein